MSPIQHFTSVADFADGQSKRVWEARAGASLFSIVRMPAIWMSVSEVRTLNS
jgi:hypothetical protein